jgi:hypothetical protein
MEVAAEMQRQLSRLFRLQLARTVALLNWLSLRGWITTSNSRIGREDNGPNEQKERKEKKRRKHQRYYWVK